MLFLYISILFIPCIFLMTSLLPAGGWWGWYWGTSPQRPDGRWGGIQSCLEPLSGNSVSFWSHRKPEKIPETFYNVKLRLFRTITQTEKKSQHTSLKLVTCSKGIFSSSSMAWRIVLSTLCIRKSNAAGFCQHTRTNCLKLETKTIESKEPAARWTVPFWNGRGCHCGTLRTPAPPRGRPRRSQSPWRGRRPSVCWRPAPACWGRRCLRGRPAPWAELHTESQNLYAAPGNRWTMQEKKWIIKKNMLNFSGLSVLFYNRTQSTDLIRLHGDDGAQSEDEGVNIFHVQVICGHGIWHRVGG